MGVFKQFSTVNERWITVDFLDSAKKYKVVQATTGKTVANGTGEELQTKGFKVVFEEEFQGELYEVTGYQ